MHKFKHSFGFTLLELMIVVFVIGVLASIAIPSYKDYINKSRRSDAKAALLTIQQAQEKYRASCTQYATAIGTYSCDTGNYKLVGSATSPDGYYNNLAFSSVSPSGYTATITATGGQLEDTNCRKLSITQNGTKSSINSSNAASSGCWD